MPELTFALTLDYGDLTEEELEGRPYPTEEDIENGVRTDLATKDELARPIRITAERQ